MSVERRTVLIAHPSPDLYGSDRQLLQTICGLVRSQWGVVVHLPADGPLVPLLREAGAEVHVSPFPVLRKALLTPKNLLGLLLGFPAALLRVRRAVRASGADAVYVNTLTIPSWPIGARLAGRPVVCHVHEAEEGQNKLIAVGLAAPLLLAKRVIVNSAAARKVLLEALRRLDRRIEIVYNGMSGPETPAPLPAAADTPARLVVVGRLSPRKGIDVALEAVARLRSQGREVTLDVCGSVFPGYEWYEDELRARAGQPDLAGAVTLHGYTNPTWPMLAAANVVLVPSRVEPFGNTAVEGLLAGRPVIASDVQGLAEIITDGRTGVLVPPGDPDALASAVAKVLDDPATAARLAEDGRAEAQRRFSPERYEADVLQLISSAAG